MRWLYRKIVEAWNRIPLEWRKELVSLSHTFITTFVTSAVAEYQMGHVVWTWTALGSLGLAIARSAWKAIVNQFIAWLKAR